jgi:hypothetical protein
LISPALGTTLDSAEQGAEHTSSTQATDPPSRDLGNPRFSLWRAADAAVLKTA